MDLYSLCSHKILTTTICELLDTVTFFPLGSVMTELKKIILKDKNKQLLLKNYWCFLF